MTPRALRLLLVAALVCGVSSELASENVTLTTYYPAPSGVYTQMITTQNTYLARDGGAVGIGTTAPIAGSKLDVVGYNRLTDPTGSYNTHLPWTDNNSYLTGANIYMRNGAPQGWAIRMTVTSGGLVGIGTTGPVQMLDVNGSATVRGWLGVTTTSPQQPLDVNGGAVVRGNLTLGNPGYYGNNRGYLSIYNGATGCFPVAGAWNGVVCGGGYYATYQPGLYIDNAWTYANKGGQPVAYDPWTGWESATVWALDYSQNPPMGKWMTLQSDRATDTFYCCPR